MRCRFNYWIAIALRNHHIHSQLKEYSRELNQVRTNKKIQINIKNTKIINEFENISRSYEFLKENESFLFGADGEEHVISALSQLPAGYHVINDVNIHFERAVRWKARNEYIKNCQIDHIVVGPTGTFLLETKNWKSSDIELKSEKLKHQVLRSNYALWYYLKDHFWLCGTPKIRTVIVSIKNPPSNSVGKFIDIVTPHNLCRYITERKTLMSEGDFHKVVRLIIGNLH